MQFTDHGHLGYILVGGVRYHASGKESTIWARRRKNVLCCVVLTISIICDKCDLDN